MPLVEVSNLTKSFQPTLHLRHLFSSHGAPIKVLDNISFKVDSGKIMGLIGPNGAGKSTIIKILSTLILPDSGQVIINGHDLATQSAEARKHIGWASGDDRHLYWRLSGRANLEFFAALYDLSPRDASYRIDELLTLLDIERPYQRVAEYSTGMKHRLNLARALLHNPAILLLDEPTRSLDPNSAETIRYFIKELGTRYHKTIILATHNLAEAETLCNRVALIDKGQIKRCGTLTELRNAAHAPSESGLEEIYSRLLESG